MYQNVTIGGQTPDKKDAVNPLSYLVLKSVAQTRLPQPNLTVRYHAGLPKEFLDECIEVMKLGTGMPAFNNDEVIIPSFKNWGVKEEDAYNYSAIGCVETAVPGKWGYRCTGMSYINFPRLLLAVMNDGVDMTSGKRFVKGSGYFKDMTSYEELLEAWDKALREVTRMSVIVENAIDLASERDVPDILCSALTDDCIGRGKTIKEGGAVYDFISGLQVGIANMADSLAAIKKLVYEEKRITPEQLWNALLDDFTSEENQKIQHMLINDAPKYGNDDDYVDNLVVEAYDTYIDEIQKYPNTRYGRGPIGGIRYAGTSSISANVGQGQGTMATPDGRNAKTEDSILKSYFQQQGLSEEEMKTAIVDFKNNKAQKEKEASENSLNLQNENATLKAQVLKMQIENVANQCALEIGVDAKTIPYLIKMADLNAVVDDKGAVSKDAVTTALTKVLEDLPQLKSQNIQNKGFTKIGAENNGSQPNTNDVLKNIFGV